jgi:hypothetical protein
MFHKYITLEELMKQVRAELLAKLASEMGMLEMMVETQQSLGRDGALKSHPTLASFEYIEKLCHECELEFSADSAERMVNLLKESAKESDVIGGLKLTEIIDEAKCLRERLHDEMKRITYFAIEPNKQSLLTGSNLFDTEIISVTSAFRSVAFDIEEAGKCLAFERWTAAVFHLSRVAENATVAICKRIDYKSDKPGFGEALKYLDSELDKARKDRKSINPLFKGDIEFLSTVSAQMHAVNEAWRQRVSHLDKKYIEEEAVRIWDTTRILMQQLATKLKETND